MNDEQWKEMVLNTYDPIELLKIIVENDEFFGYDSYYKDLRAVMIAQAEKIIERAER